MPEVKRPLVAGGPVRRGGLHGWIGSRLRKGFETSPALWDSMAARLQPGIELRREPGPVRLRGGRARWTVRAVNANAGHHLPTGDPGREVFVELLAIGATGDTLGRADRVIAQKFQWSPVVKKLSDSRLAPGESVPLTIEYRAPRGPYTLIARAFNVRISDADADDRRLPRSYPRRSEVVRVMMQIPAGWR
jgi:hypothetical protein